MSNSHLEHFDLFVDFCLDAVRARRKGQPREEEPPRGEVLDLRFCPEHRRFDDCWTRDKKEEAG